MWAAAFLVLLSALAVRSDSVSSSETATAAALSTTTSQVQLRTDALAWLKGHAAPKQSTRRADPLMGQLSNKARLMFRALDLDHDNRVDKNDVLNSNTPIHKHLPGVSSSEFLTFIELADQDGDGKLDQNEFLEGMAQGVENTQFVETDAKVGRRGFLSSIGQFVGQIGSKLAEKAKQMMSRANGKVDKSNDGCVLCQYIVERCETNVKAAGVIPAITGATMGPSIFLETSVSVMATAKSRSRLQALNKLKSKAKATTTQTPFDMAASSVIGATRQSTRYQRQLERQKYNEIYRVVDITLDDVCEEGMPNFFYSYCMAVYQQQSDVVDGLRYQYRPADICFRVGLCGKGSYITKGIHSRYKT